MFLSSETLTLLLSFGVEPAKLSEIILAIEADYEKAITDRPDRLYARAPRTKLYGPAQDPDSYWSEEKHRAYQTGALFVEGPPTPRLRDADWWPLVGAVYDLRGLVCTYCGADDRYLLHCDHIAPISRGGLNVIENLTPACDACNCAKKDRLPHEWRPAFWVGQ